MVDDEEMDVQHRQVPSWPVDINHLNISNCKNDNTCHCA